MKWKIFVVTVCVTITLAALADVRCTAAVPAPGLVVVACGAGRLAR